MLPTLSVLMATKDNLPTLPKALGTFLDSPIDLEIVIVNDGSKDQTRDYLESLPRKRVKAIHLSESGGLTKALNLAFKESRGAFLARQDADDTSHPDRLQSQLYRFQEQSSLDILGTGQTIVDEKGETLAELEGRNFRNPVKRLLQDNFFCHGSLMIRRPAFEKLKGYRDFFRFSQDYDLLLRAAGMGLRLGNLKACLYNWTFSPYAISGLKAKEQARFAETARQVFRNPKLEPSVCFDELAARDRSGSDLAKPVPAEWHLMKIMLRAGDTQGARRQYNAMVARGEPIPENQGAAKLRFIPGWLYRPLRSIADLKYL